MLTSHHTMIAELQRLWHDDSGATSIEYGLIAVIVAVGIVVSLYAYAEAADSLFTYVDTTVTGAIGS